MPSETASSRTWLFTVAGVLVVSGGVFVALQFLGGNGASPKSPSKSSDDDKLVLPSPPPKPMLDVGPSILAAFDSKHLDALDRARIPPLELYPWQPKELVAVLGQDRLRGSHLALSPDGSLAAAWDHAVSRFVNVGDTTTLHPQVRLLEEALACAPAFSPDNRLLAVAREKSIAVWDIKAAKVVKTLDSAGSSRLLFLTNQRLLVAGGTRLEAWDLDKGAVVQSFKGHTGPVFALAASSGGGRILSGGGGDGGGDARLWESESGKELGKVVVPEAKQPLPPYGITSVALSRDGKQAAVGINNQTLQLWDADQFGVGKPAHLVNPPNQAMSLAYSADGQRLLVGTQDGTTLFEAKTAASVHSFTPRGYSAVAFHERDSRRHIVAATVEVRSVEEDGGHEALPPTGVERLAQCVALSPDGRFIAAGGQASRLACCWDLAMGKSIFPAHNNQILTVGFAPDASFFFMGGQDSPAPMLLDPVTGKKTTELKTQTAPHLASAAVSRDGRFLLGGYFDGTNILWDLRTGRVERTFKSAAPRVEIAPGGHYALSPASAPAKLWSLDEDKDIDSLPGSAHFLPDGNILVRTEKETLVRTITAEGLKDVSKLPAFPSGQSVLSGDGKRLALFSHDAVQVFELKSGVKLFDWPTTHGHFVVSAATLSPDGRYLLTANSNATVYVFRLP